MEMDIEWEIFSALCNTPHAQQQQPATSQMKTAPAGGTILLEQELKDARTERNRLAGERHRRAADNLAEANRKLSEMAHQKEAAEEELKELQRRNERLNAQISELRKGATYTGSKGENSLDEETWQTLLTFDEKQLRQWVMAGNRFAQKYDDSPVETAIRWELENRLE